VSESDEAAMDTAHTRNKSQLLSSMQKAIWQHFFLTRLKDLPQRFSRKVEGSFARPRITKATRTQGG
jgi:hypothetical protein